MGFFMSVYSGYCERSLIPRRVLVCVLPLPEPPTRLPLSEAWMLLLTTTHPQQP
jgi:hypothetical protein